MIDGPSISPELAQQPQPVRAFEALATNPARALAYLIVAETQQPLTTAEIGRRFIMRQGGRPGRQMAADGAAESVARKCCANILEPFGLIDKTMVTGVHGEALAFTASPDDIENNKALAGAILDWELLFSKHRLFDRLGQTRDYSDHALPLKTFDICRALLDTPRGMASARELEIITGRSKSAVHHALKFLVEAGCIEKLLKTNLAHRRVALLPTSNHYITQYGHRLTPASRAVYETVEALRSEGHTEIDGQTFLQHLLAAHPAITEGEVRYVFNRNPPPPFIKLTDREYFGKDGTTHRLTTEWEPAMADLALRIRLLKESPEFAVAARQRAAAILKTPEDVAFLLAKTQETWEPSEVNRQAEAARQMGSLTLQELATPVGWEGRAACGGHDPELFFPVNDRAPTPAEEAKAKKICVACTERGACLQSSIDSEQQFGIQGGLTIVERRKYLQKPRVLVSQNS